MDIVAAVFIENIELRQAPGPSTRIDLTGVHFSMAAPTPAPVTVEPHLVVLVRCPLDEGTVPRTVYKRDGEQIARQRGAAHRRAAYRLVRAELEFETYGSGR